MKFSFNLYLTAKNGLSIVVGLCLVVLAVIPLRVDPAHLGWLRWQIVIYASVLVGITGRKAIRNVETTDGPTTPLATQSVELEAESAPAGQAATGIDGEVYRLAMSPRSWGWALVKDIYRIQGRADEATVDTDILVELYLVNRATDKTRYIRDMQLFAEVAGKRVEFKRQNDLLGPDFNNQKYEYGLRGEKFRDVQPIKQLYDKLPLALAPEQPIEGWVRFTAAEINPDKIVQGTITLTVVDSLGNEHPIHKTATDRKHQGEIGMRRSGR